VVLSGKSVRLVIGDSGASELTLKFSKVRLRFLIGKRLRLVIGD
jgi:hypothetical protein